MADPTGEHELLELLGRRIHAGIPGELGLPDELDLLVAELSAGVGDGGGDGGGEAGAGDVGGADGGAGATAATKPVAGKRRGIVNETGVPACLEMLQPAGEMGAGAGVAAGAVLRLMGSGSGWRKGSTPSGSAARYKAFCGYSIMRASRRRKLSRTRFRAWAP